MAENDGEHTGRAVEMIREIRDKVRARHPSGQAGDGTPITLPDLMPLVQARDAAEAKVAAIGTVNPRPAGPLNALVQRLKRLVARALDWHVREQVEFNRGVVDCINATIESMNEMNRTTSQLAVQMRDGIGARQRELQESLHEQARQMEDLRNHWAEWRPAWEARLTESEIKLLRNIADLQGAFQHRVTQMEATHRELVRARHSEFETALGNATLAIQKQFWSDMEKAREQQERLIHNELRVVRQRARARPPATEAAPPSAPTPMPEPMDSLCFANRFRGTGEHVRELQEFYADKFQGCGQVLDLGCGRGEFLQVMEEAGIEARGVDSSEELVRLCRNKGLRADRQDLFEYLEASDDSSLDGIFCGQVVEHLPPESLPRLVKLAAAKLRRGGRIAIETPNPECLAIFATHFYLDPTHTRPVPASLLVFYLEEAGFGRIEVEHLSPAQESMPEVAELPRAFKEKFFGGLDYAVLGRKL